MTNLQEDYLDEDPTIANQQWVCISIFTPNSIKTPEGKVIETENHVRAVREAITYVEKEFGWEVLFLGANIDVKRYASSMGIKAMNAANFVGTGKGVIDAMTTVSASASAYRGSSFSVGGVTMNASNLDTSALYDAVTRGEKVEYDDNKD
jgi:hypothetical protein